MKRYSTIQSRITTGRTTLPATMLISAFCWILASLLLPESTATRSGYLLLDSIRAFSFPTWVSHLLGFLFYGIAGYLLVELNNTFAIIRMRASAQTSIYFMLVAACPAIYLLHAANIVSTAFLLAVFFLFRGYQHPRPSGTIFFSFLFIGIGTLFFPQLILLIPFLWLSAYHFQALTTKSFFASLVGWGLPFWCLAGYAYFCDQMELFYSPFIELATFHPVDFSAFAHWELATLGYLFILFATSSIHCFLASYEDKIRTRSYLNFTMLLNLLLFVFIALQPAQTAYLLPVLMMGVSILTGHLVVLTNSRTSNVFFICILAGWLLLVGFNVWTLL